MRDHLAGIRAVTFDAGGTLMAPWPSVGHVYAGVARRHVMPLLKPELLNQRFAAAWKNKSNFDYSQESWERLVRETFAEVTEASDARRLFEEVYAVFAEAPAWKVFDDVGPTFARLREMGIRIGIISNWDERLRPLLVELGLARFCEAIVVSCEAGVVKPARAIFDVALGLLRLPADGVLHVGDSASEDYSGALAAGMRALLLERDAERDRPGMIRSLKELIADCRLPRD